MGDYEVENGVFLSILRQKMVDFGGFPGSPVPNIGVVGSHPAGMQSGAAYQCAEHGRAEIDGVDFDGAIGSQQLSGETAIAVAQNQSVTATPKFA